MPIGEPIVKDWSDAKKIVLRSEEQLKQLVSEGYEVIGKNFHFTNDQGGYLDLRLKKADSKIVANANSIFEYVLHLVDIYDFEKKKPVFVWVSDTSVYWQFEEALLMLRPDKNIQPIITTKELLTAIPNRIYTSLLTWIDNEKNRTYGIKKISEMFSLVVILEEKDGSLTRRTFSKEEITLRQITKIIIDAKGSDNTIALSPILLSKKIQGFEEFGDVLIGLILYDLKNDEVLAFNMQSLTTYIERHETDSRQGLHDVVRYLFLKTITTECKHISYIPLPLHSPWYTVLPWICYSALAQVKPRSVENNFHRLSPENMNIAQFFTFGYPTLADEGYSFDFSDFASNKRGRASCILNFNHDGDGDLKYILRYDRHPAKPLVHLDFAFYDKAVEYKIISHRPLDLEEVYTFNSRLYMAMMFAGLFDGYFNTLLQANLKGLEELRNQNPAFLYSFKYVWLVETSISWLNEHPVGYIVLDKLFKYQKLAEHEQKIAKEMCIGDLSLVMVNKKQEVEGLTYFGYMVYVRYKRNQTGFRVT